MCLIKHIFTFFLMRYIIIHIFTVYSDSNVSNPNFAKRMLWLERRVFFTKRPHQVRRTDASLRNVMQRTFLYASVCQQAFGSEEAPFLNVKWNLEHPSTIYLYPRAQTAQKLKTNLTRRHPEALCNTSGVKFLSKKRQGHGMSKSR